MKGSSMYIVILIRDYKQSKKMNIYIKEIQKYCDFQVTYLLFYSILFYSIIFYSILFYSESLKRQHLKGRYFGLSPMWYIFVACMHLFVKPWNLSPGHFFDAAFCAVHKTLLTYIPSPKSIYTVHYFVTKLTKLQFQVLRKRNCKKYIPKINLTFVINKLTFTFDVKT